MSTSTEKKIAALLKQHRFTLVRQTKHKIFQAPTGHVFVTSSTPSDFRAYENQLTTLKRVIANPPMAMVLAISEFEREEAARVIQGQQKLQHAASGMGAGKQRRSRGTGFRYETKEVLTAEQLAHNELLRQQALENVRRREEKKQQRRTEKLARREKAVAQREQEAAEFEEAYRPFLNVTQRLADAERSGLNKGYEAVIAHRAWQPDSNFYEFPEPGSEDAAAEKLAHVWVRTDFPTLEENDEYISEEVLCFSKYLARSEQVQNRLMKFIERQMKESDSLFNFMAELNDKIDQISKDDYGVWDTRRQFIALYNRLQAWSEGLGWTEELHDELLDIYVHKNELIFVKADNENEDETLEAAVDFVNPVQEPEVAAEAVEELVEV